jgi:hypothetical protein
MSLANLIGGISAENRLLRPCQQDRPVLVLLCGTPCKYGLWRSWREPVNSERLYKRSRPLLRVGSREATLCLFVAPAKEHCSSWNLPTPAAGTCRLAGVEPCRGTQKGENRACRLQLVSDGSCTSCMCACSAGRTAKKRCALSLHRASQAGGFRGPIAAQLVHNRSKQGAKRTTTCEAPNEHSKEQRNAPKSNKNAMNSKKTQQSA